MRTRSVLIHVLAVFTGALLGVGHADATLLYYSSAGPHTTENTNATGAVTLDTSQTFNSGTIYLGFDAVRNNPTGSAVSSFAGVELGSGASNDGAGGQMAFGNRWTENDWGWFINAGASGNFSPATPVGNSVHRVVAKLDYSGTAQMFLDPADAVEGSNPSVNTGQTPNAFQYLHLRSGNAGNNYTWSDLVVADNFAQAAGFPAPSPEPLVSQINFTHNTSEPGWHSAGTDTAISPLDRPDGTPTDITMTTTNPFGWTWDQGPNTAYTAANGVVFPAGVADRNVGDNTHHSGRDSLGVIRLSSPTEYEYELTFLAAFDTNPGITQFNVGGAWNPQTMSFDGGTTVEIDPDISNALPKTGTINALSTWDAGAGAYIVDLQVGNTSGGTTVGALNGLHIRATVPGDPIPEPATLALLSLAACGLGGYVRRRRKA